jgi:prepilin-type N-terminal cleavage/methylation domain-containing protein
VRQRLHAIRRSDSGFTLTELLIVIVILGVLTGIVVFAVGAFTDRGDMAACKADRKTVEAAVEAFRAQSPTGAYPANLNDLVTGQYLRQVPTSTKYTINYFPAAVAGPPPVAAGTVTGSLINGTACV